MANHTAKASLFSEFINEFKTERDKFPWMSSKRKELINTAIGVILAQEALQKQQESLIRELECRLCGNVTADHMALQQIVDLVKSSGTRIAGPYAEQAGRFEQAVLEACVVAHMPFWTDDAKKTIDNLIKWHTDVALDPAVSKQAQDLIKQGRNEARDQSARLS